MNFNVNYITMILVHAKFPIRGRIVRDSVNYTSRVGSHVVFAWIHFTDVRIHCTDILIECR